MSKHQIFNFRKSDGKYQFVNGVDFNGQCYI